MTESTLKCSTCGSEALTPPTKLSPPGHMQGLFLTFALIKPTFFAQMKSVTVDHARACLDCGALSMALTTAQLADLKRHLPELKPMT